MKGGPMADLIYDVGAHLGEDSQHYLAKGFKVVAIEANPELAARLRQRFTTEMTDGRFTLVECVISEETGYQTFYVNETLSIWSEARDPKPGDPAPVPAIRRDHERVRRALLSQDRR
jgi:FkbM family methyltransferase